MSLQDELRQILLPYCAVPDEPGAKLELDSLSLIQLVEDLEVKYQFRVRPAELSAEHFGSLAVLSRFIESKRA